MPVVVMHGGSGASSGNCALSTKSVGPSSHMCLSVFVLLLNPPLGLLALGLSCWSRQTATMDWEGAQTKGRLALWFSIAGIVITVVAALVFVLVFFTKDT